MTKLYTAVFFFLMIQITGCASVITGGLAKGGYQASPQDRATTSRIRKELGLHARLDTSRVRINTYRGAVTLNGYVDTAKSEQQIMVIVRNVPGVSRVISRLVVRTR